MSCEVLGILSMGSEVVDQSGRHYLLSQILQEKGNPLGSIYLATSGTENFVLKHVPDSHFSYMRDMYRMLCDKKYLRIAEDAVPERSIFAYRYLDDHFLSFAQEEISLSISKRILKDTLRGLIALHEKNIVHTDIKPNNILRVWEHGSRVQLADIEHSALIPANSDIVGRQVGNQMWRSPEAHCEGRVNKPSDMFSFGIVVSLRQVIFAVSAEELEDGAVEPLSVILERQISYFADEEALKAMLNYLGDSPWCEALEAVATAFSKTCPRKPVSHWTGIDEDFRDLLVGLTDFNPEKRLTAKEALEHKWFGDVD
ncbi:hypothetical protein MMC11_006652 [Xylographa trunciseda]|nr:hypothetical protein [Xylographa trunciseda]